MGIEFTFAEPDRSGEGLEAAGVSPDLVRLSTGIEDIDGLIGDIEQALAGKQAIPRKTQYKSIICPMCRKG